VTRFLDATRERFLVAIANQLPAERFLELYFFSPIRQGGVESGVAVIAAHPVPSVIPSEARDLLSPEGEEHEIPRRFTPRDENRYTVYTATYKLTLKGPDRGKWEHTVTAEADAPLVTVETVVRGVQRRSGDSEDPERMSGDDARNYVLAAAR
jgi:hypothetical protein